MHPIFERAMVHEEDHAYRAHTKGWNEPADFQYKQGWSSYIAVSRNGAVWKKSSQSSYVDKIRYEAGEGGATETVLYYVCGCAEELRRQKQLRHGDAVHVLLYQSKRGSDGTRKAGVVRGTFDRIVGIEERGAWGKALLTQHSRAVLDAWLDAALRFVALPAPPPEAGDACDATLALVPSQPSAFDARTVHFLFDTESAAPRRCEERDAHSARRANPVVQVGYVCARHTFLGRPIEARESLLRYPDSVATGYGADSSVQKFTALELELAPAAADVLADVFARLVRTSETNGLVVGHNAMHDLRQLKASAEALGVPLPPHPLRVFDTMLAAGNFIDAGRDWLRLGSLAAKCGVPYDTHAAHEAGYDTDVVLRIVRHFGVHAMDDLAGLVRTVTFADVRYDGAC